VQQPAGVDLLICLSATTLRTYEEAGACEAGACSYLFADTTCPWGCGGGMCNGDPCAGVQCDQPPSGCYQQAGTLADPLIFHREMNEAHGASLVFHGRILSDNNDADVRKFLC
jgi:hypothetical protein